MPSVAKHIATLQPSATLALNAKARILRDQGLKIENFSVGEPDFSWPEIAGEEAIRSIKKDPICYGTAGGTPELRKSIQQKLLQENHLQVDLDQIVCGVGAKQILYHLIHALLDPEDEVMIHLPCWTSYPQQIASAHGKWIPIPMIDHLKQDQDPFDPEYLEKFFSPKTKALLLCSPNNPAGYVLSKKQLTKLADYLMNKDIWLISDEIYEYYTYRHPHLSLVDVCKELKDRYIHINGISKSFAMTGWRMGYMAGPKPVASLVKTLISHSSTCLPIFVEKAATRVIQGGKELVASHIATMKAKRDLAVSLLIGIQGVTLLNPDGAFYLFLDLREKLHHSQDYPNANTLQLSLDLLHHHHLSVLAGEAFGCPGFLRISYAKPTEDISKGLTKLRDFLEKDLR